MIILILLAAALEALVFPFAMVAFKQKSDPLILCTILCQVAVVAFAVASVSLWGADVNDSLVINDGHDDDSGYLHHRFGWSFYMASVGSLVALIEATLLIRAYKDSNAAENERDSRYGYSLMGS